MVTIEIPSEFKVNAKDVENLKTKVENMLDCKEEVENDYDIFDGTYIKQNDHIKPNEYKPDIVPSEDDPVNHPGHYTYGSIECIDYITDKQFDFCLGNAVKYITRAGHKKDAIEDLKKAAWYINKEIEMLQHEQ